MFAQVRERERSAPLWAFVALIAAFLLTLGFALPANAEAVEKETLTYSGQWAPGTISNSGWVNITPVLNVKIEYTPSESHMKVSFQRASLTVGSDDKNNGDGFYDGLALARANDTASNYPADYTKLSPTHTDTLSGALSDLSNWSSDLLWGFVENNSNYDDYGEIGVLLDGQWHSYDYDVSSYNPGDEVVLLYYGSRGHYTAAESNGVYSDWFAKTSVKSVLTTKDLGIDIVIQPKVTFVDGFTNETIETQSVDYGGDATAPEIPSHTGYTATGWDKSFTNVTEDITVTVCYSPISYYVKYDKNSDTATGNMTDQYMVYDNPQNLNTNAFKMTGYTFTGWNTKADGTGDAYTDKQEVENLTAEDGGTVTLYAQWRANAYEIAFDANTGVGTMANQAMTYDVAANLNANAFTKTGYTWTGWNTKADGTGTTYTDEQSVKNLTAVDGGTVTLYAQWEINQYTVTFTDELTGDPVCPPQTVPYGGAADDPGVPEHTGYTGDWDKSFDNITGDTDVIAKYTPNPYKIKFDANTGTGSMEDQAMTYDVAANLNANAFAKTGYTWTGWNTAADGTGDAYTDKQEVENLTAEKDGVVTLYSQWEANSYIVRFHANEGTGTMDDQSFVYDVAQALDDNEFTRTGYTFQGWATSEDSAVVYTDEEVVKNLAADDGAVVNLYAVWDENADVTITYKPEDDHSTVSNDDDVVPPATGEPEGSTATTEEGYHFVGWVDAEGNLLSDDPIYMPERGEDGLWHAMTAYSRVAPNGYSVTFDANEGTGSMEDESFTYDVAQPLDPNAFEREGYTFTGWNTEPDGTGTAFADEEEVKNLTTEDGGNVVVYAQWIANEYVVEFDANSGDGEMDDQSFVYDVAQELNANAFTKTGYTWTGWNTKADGTGDSYADAEEVKNLTAEDSGTVTLYSQWKANAYVVHFNGNGGEGTMDDQSFVYDEAQQLSENAFARDGYFFKGWALTEDGEVVYTDMEEVVNLVADDGGEITLYAVWEAAADNSAATSSSADGSTYGKTGGSDFGLIAAIVTLGTLGAACGAYVLRNRKKED